MRRGVRIAAAALTVLAVGEARAGDAPARPQQVVLRTRFVDVARDDVRALGVDWSGNAPSAQPLGGSALPVLGALLRDEAPEQAVLATPQVTTRTGSPAEIEVGDPERVAVQLQIAPTVDAKGRIVLRLEVVTAQPGLSRLLGTQVAIPDGGTVVIGGLFTDETREAARGVPGLSDVPVLGTLFRRKSFQQGRNDLMILVTPYLVGEFGGRSAGSAPPQAVQPRPDPGIQVPNVPQAPHSPRPGYGSP